MSCIFCKIADKEIPAKIIYEDHEVMVFHDIAPQAPQHILIIPRKHYPSLSETENPQILQNLLSSARTVAQQLNLTDYRLVINNGPKAGQTVMHLHLHLLAGRQMNWPPG